MDSWGVIKIRSGREARVIASLTLLGIETYCPRWKVTWAHHGHCYERLVPMFLNYVLARFDLDDPVLWHQLMRLSGVAGIMGGAIPSRIREEEVLRLRDATNRVSLQVTKPLLRFQEGQSIKLRGGMVGNFIFGDGTMATVKIALLGRDFMLQVPEALCDPADLTSRGPWSGRLRNRRRHRRLGNNRVSHEGEAVPDQDQEIYPFITAT